MTRPGARAGVLVLAVMTAALPAAARAAGPSAAGAPPAGAPPHAERRAAAAGELSEIIVTGTREEILARVPNSVALITREDIATAPSADLIDLLSREANVTLRSFTGNDKTGGVDIRGQGDTFGSNVVVLIDGVRLNASDLSGADFASVPLASIERIEIVRGGGAVRYGDGAVGGVVNIVTGAEDGTRAEAGLSYGDFDTVNSNVSAAGSRGPLHLAVDAAWSDTDGYRDNAGLARRTLSGKLRYAMNDALALSAAATVHDDDYGLPGPVSRASFSGAEALRRRATTPDAFGRSGDRRYQLGGDINVGPGTLKLLAWHRNRDSDVLPATLNPDLEPGTQLFRVREESTGGEAVYRLPLSLLGRGHRLTLGIDAASTDYRGCENGCDTIDQSIQRPGEVERLGGFAALSLALGDRVDLELGYRRLRHAVRRSEIRPREVCDEQVFMTVTFCIPGTERVENVVTADVERTWHGNLFEAGLVYTPVEALNLFVKYAESFRAPNVDELVVSATGLGPQTGRHWDTGARWRWRDKLEASLTLFHVRTDNEIVYARDPFSGLAANRNADAATYRRGGEFELRAYPLQSLSLWLNLGYADTEVGNSDKPIPLVARETAAAGLLWQPLRALQLSLAARHVGERADGNDFGTSVFPTLPAYQVVDARLGWQHRRLRVSAGINNLTDEVYASSGYSGTLYPMPGRHAWVGIGWRL